LTLRFDKTKSNTKGWAMRGRTRYKDFDKGVARKFVLDPHGLVA